MTASDPTVQAMIEGRRADTGRRRRRVLTALAQAAKDGSDVSVAAIARRAGVDRTFLYRHRDLLGQIHAMAAEPAAAPEAAGQPSAGPPCKPICWPPTPAPPGSPPRSAASKPASAKSGASRSGARPASAAPRTPNRLKAWIITLEQQVIDLELKIQDRDDDLAAARATNCLAAQRRRWRPCGRRFATWRLVPAQGAQGLPQHAELDLGRSEPGRVNQLLLAHVGGVLGHRAIDLARP
ncbi:hypothetical protein [Streptomyces sp. NPDC102462]|uniref:hypothetical protein n=1 Tax=Streptomyces sp. NPDC102462 TaxID=3366178 RepID=UPI00380299F4